MADEIVPVTSVNYTDVEGTASYATKLLDALGIMKGITPTEFGALNLITRGEAAEIVSRLANIADKVKLLETSDSKEEREASIFESLVLLEFVPARKVENIAERAIDLVNQTVFEDLTVDEIAEKLNVGIHQLNYTFKKHTSITIAEYRNAVRVTKAKRLLKSDMDLKKVAVESGFRDISTMTKEFMKNENVSPEKYRECFCD